MQSDYEKKKKLKDTISWALSMLALVLSAVVAVYAFNFGKRIADAFAPAARPSASMQALETELGKLRTELDRLKAAPQPTPASAPGQATQELQQAIQTVKALDVRLASLEAAILANPAKALEIPLIQRDIDGLKLSQQAANAVLKDSVDRIYDLNKWLLGGLAVSILSLALSSFVRGKSRSGES